MPPPYGGSKPQGTFGLVPQTGPRNSGNSRFPSRRPPGGTNFKGSRGVAPDVDDNGMELVAQSELRFQEIEAKDAMDEKMGFARHDGPAKSGWMVNMHPTLVRDDEWPSGRSAVDYYFIEDDGSTFKSTVIYSPYFLLMCKPGTEADVEEFLKRKYERMIELISWCEKEDLDMPNHLLGLKRTVLKLSFRNVQDLLRVRKDMLAAVKKQRPRDADVAVYDAATMNVQVGAPSARPAAAASSSASRSARNADPLACILDVREYDVPYYLRVAIDLDLRVGIWYTVTTENGKTEINVQADKLLPPDPVVLAFDIETTKLPLKFPDAAHDQVMMISYVIDGQGYLITNREIVSEDIDDFEYTPKPEFEGPFVVFNEANEFDLLRRFFDHIVEVQPHVIVTYNGDFFDWPFVEARAKAHGLDMREEIGWFKDENDEYKSSYAHHSDCFRWVKRDSYLPAGSHGLKAVTTAKLGYNPLELDPELMVQYAQEKPQVLAQYSVSDAVATYYLYMKYVHPFVFSLCNIIPMNPDEVLRKGSGTLCESLLMVKAFKAEVLMPNKHVDVTGQFYNGHLLTSESYVGGHVEALEAGVFRSDIPTKFKVDPETVAKLMADVERALVFTCEVEHNVPASEVTNLAEVRDQILAALDALRTTPNRLEKPLIYHLDVAAMYPNIILTNRLQPDAMVDEADCAACDYNDPANGCQRPLEWKWRGEYFPATRGDYHMVLGQLKQDPAWFSMPAAQQEQLLNKRLGDYSRKVYKKIHENEVVVKTSTVCQRENPFYIDTVRQFRDRRYEYKGLLKVWKGKLEQAQARGDTGGVAEGKKMVVVMDSLQLAHKCILNSFYGYVMRKGSRWYSMEMGGIVCYTGAKIIQLARELVERVGRPLELDTDGIWCILPKSFPENFVLKTTKGKKVVVSYPCTMLNHLVHDRFTNHQYQSRDEAAAGGWKTNAENSILFEVDGPYKAMILPASTEEDKLLKKRYAVFNEDGSMAECKGFEVKRRGELKLIKIFQSQIFSVFLKGTSLETCYAAVAQVANEWLDVLDGKGATMADAELIDLISENKNMSKALSEYEGQKSSAITTAKRLAEFLGSEMVKDKLACHFLIARQPLGAPVAERALPVAILHAEPAVRRHFMRKWFRDPTVQDPDVRDLIDWDYYKERFGSVLQKLITIPAAMQGVTNPIPRVKHPEWLRTRVNDARLQSKLTDLFDIEDMRRAGARGLIAPPLTTANGQPRLARVTRVARRKTAAEELAEMRDQLRAEPCPDPTRDYPAWIKYQKVKWRFQRMAAKHRDDDRVRNAGATGSASTAAAAGGDASAAGGAATGNQMDAFLRQQQASLESSVWHVLQVDEGPGGTHTVWALVGDKLHQLPLKIPRTFYVNSTVPVPAAAFDDKVVMEPVKMTLPRGVAPAQLLYKCTVDEDVYRAHARTFAQFFAHPLIEGVYETRMPGQFRAVAALGACWTVDRKRGGAAATRNVQWPELRMANAAASAAYLARCPLDDVWVYHLSKNDRHLVVVYSFRGSQDCHVFVADPSATASVGHLDDTYGQFRTRHMAAAAAARANGDESVDDTAAAALPLVGFQVAAFRKESQMLAALQKFLAGWSARRGAPALVTVQSNKPSSLAFVKALSQFPTAKRPPAPRDAAEMPALNWQAYAVQRWLSQLGSFAAWKRHTLALARFAQVPVGNLGNDPTLFALDVLLARRLAASDHVAWYSAESRPDVGGRQADEHYSVLDAHQALPEVNRPGHYAGVTVDLEVYGLCVAAILELAAPHSHPELQPLFGVVKDLGLRAREHNAEANTLLGHVYRWLTTAAAYLYDPRATFVVFNQMQRVFMALVTEFTKLNALVVYASFSRLVLQTPKATVAQARAFVQFLESHVAQQPQFVALTLTPVAVWRPLAWMDSFNYGGYRLVENSAQDMEVDGGEEGVEFQLSMQWNVADYLPESMAPTLLELVAFYFAECHAYAATISPVQRQQQLTAAATGLGMTSAEAHQDDEAAVFNPYGRQGAKNAMAPPAPVDPTAGGGNNMAEAKFKSKLVRTELTMRLLRVLPAFQRAEHGVDRMQFPWRPGSLVAAAAAAAATSAHAGSGASQQASTAAAIAALTGASSGAPGAPATAAVSKSPTVELVKYLATILGLDAHVEDAVRVLKRNALDLLRVREFAAEAQFVNPCLPVVVPQVICTGCHFTRDLDLTRDTALLAPAGSSAQAGGWRCPDCATGYPLATLEAKLLELVENSVLAHQVQDLVCTKCRLVQRENLAPYCACSGALGLVRGGVAAPAAFRAKLAVIRDLAATHRMELLKEVVEFTMGVMR
ncbi:DNA polymerase epsilon catalytic subunit [Blastocladiella emersonii ATCC 22665]|nr:DNA polymerase epsilon catalytic subunit [Blastocladiella emersonii ATCC 22665]